MNDWDRDNLNILLNAARETKEDWYHMATEDDFKYATELFRRARTELAMQELALVDSEAVEDMTEACSVLARFRL
jgi:hypothetical protein